MRFWKLLAYLWPSGRSSADRRRGARRIPIAMDSLHETDLLEDRNIHSTLWPERDVSDRPRPAEVAHVASAHGLHQIARLQTQFHRLSVVVVDYLLEHEWFSLLGKYRRRQSGGRHDGRGPRDKAMHVPTDDGVDFTDEPNCTVCVGESPWSIVAAIEQTPPPCSTTTTQE